MAVVFARFVPLARTLTPVVAGVGRMPRVQFARFNVTGALGWASLTLGGGNLFGGVPWVSAHIGLLALAVAALSLLPLLMALLRPRRDALASLILPERVDESIGERASAPA